MKPKSTNLPESHKPYTDKYFIRTNEILKKEGINPFVSMNIFCRGEGPVAGLDEAIEILKKYSSIEHDNGEVWVTTNEQFTNKMPLMIIKGPVQGFVEMETMVLGVLSNAISEAMGFETSEPKQITDQFKRLKDIYMEIPIIYFGARHYHWSLDKDIAGAVLKGGATQTSTDVGSSNIGQKGVGTTPHILTVVLGYIYGKENATLKSAELFDKHIPLEVPRVTLVDTFNREITDALAVAKYFGIRKNSFRVDTCLENVGEGGSLFHGQKKEDPEYITGPGVTIELVTNLRNALIKNGFGSNTDIFLSSGFGNEAKARAFVAANREYFEKTGHHLFTGVGIGEISTAKFCTADVFEVEGTPFSKTGREIESVDYSTMKRVM